jgi:predicted NBD/HSP70 family sugar kinase
MKSAVKGTNLEHARSHNRRAVLDAVRTHGTLSRADLARKTSLTIQTISNIVAELEDSGLLMGGKTTRNPRGQPSIPYSINPDGGAAFGFHLARHRVIGLLSDLNGKILAQEEVKAETSDPGSVSPIVERCIEHMLSSAGVDPEKIFGIGVAVPARFGLGTLTREGPTGLPAWDDEAARETFRSALPFPAFIENDAVAAAIGEHEYGVAKGIDNFVLLFLEEGLGASLFLNGSVFKGASLSAGEIGHMVMDPDGKLCPCGNKGCLERYVSLQAAFEHSGQTTRSITPIDVGEFSAEHLTDWIAAAAPKLRQAVSILETIADTETIILNGLASRELLSALVTSAYPLHISVRDKQYAPPRLQVGTIGRLATALGAAALPIFLEMNPRFDVLMKQDSN